MNITLCPKCRTALTSPDEVHPCIEAHVHTNKCRWIMDIGIPYTSDETLQHALTITSSIEEMVDGKFTGAGAGFGYRDMQFEFTNKPPEDVTTVQEDVVAYLRECGFVLVVTQNTDPAAEPATNTPYVDLSCETENEEDPQYRQEIMWDRICPIYFDTGPKHDPSRVQCLKDDEWHYDSTYGTDHVGKNPFTEDAEDVVVWKGGGSVSGDPLKTNNVRWDMKWTKEAQAEYFHEIEKRLFPNAVN